MSIAVHLEELTALLSLASGYYNDDYQSLPLTKLLNGWSKRVPDADKRKVFSLVPPSVWKRVDGSYSVWVFEQKRKFPKEINCSVEAIWPTDYFGPIDLDPNVLADRLLAMAENPKTRRAIPGFVDGVVVENNVFDKIGKDPKLAASFSKTLEKMLDISSDSVEGVLRILPPSVSKKINLGARTLQVQKEAALTQALRSSTSTASHFLSKTLPLLGEMEVALVVKNYQLCDAVVQKMHKEGVAVAQKMHAVLASKGWSKPQISHLTPSPTLQKDIFEEFLPYWLEHKRKEVFELGGQMVKQFCREASVKTARQHANFWAQLKAAGVPLAECSAAIKTQKIDVGDWIGEGLAEIVTGRKTFPALCAGKFGAYSLKGVAPDEIVGMLAIFAHLGGQKMDLEGLGVMAAVLPKSAQQSLEYFEDWYDGKMGPKAYDLQQKYLALSEKMNLQQAIGKPDGGVSVSRQRKM